MDAGQRGGGSRQNTFHEPRRLAFADVAPAWRRAREPAVGQMRLEQILQLGETGIAETLRETHQR